MKENAKLTAKETQLLGELKEHFGLLAKVTEALTEADPECEDPVCAHCGHNVYVEDGDSWDHGDLCNGCSQCVADLVGLIFRAPREGYEVLLLAVRDSFYGNVNFSECPGCGKVDCRCAVNAPDEESADPWAPGEGPAPL